MCPFLHLTYVAVVTTAVGYGNPVIPFNFFNVVVLWNALKEVRCDWNGECNRNCVFVNKRTILINYFYCLFVCMFLVACLPCYTVFTLHFSCLLHLLLVRSQPEHLRPIQVQIRFSLTHSSTKSSSVSLFRSREKSIVLADIKSGCWVECILTTNEARTSFVLLKYWNRWLWQDKKRKEELCNLKIIKYFQNSLLCKSGQYTEIVIQYLCFFRCDGFSFCGLRNLFLDFWDFPFNSFCLLCFIFFAMVFTMLQERKISSSATLYSKAFS